VDPVQVFVLAVLQGITEFLPISSSGHLILVPALLGWPDQGLGFDIAVHIGSLSAIVIYFRHDLLNLGQALFRPGHRDSRFAWSILIATIPLGLAGLLFGDLVSTSLRTPSVIASATVGFGIVLWAADRYGRGNQNEHELGWTQVMLIGFSQALALIPGTSRSGATMTMGLMLGLSRAAAARFSFLLSIPAIAAAGSWQILEFASDPMPVPWGSLAAATLISGVTAFLAIAAFLRLIERLGMLIFAAYRVLLGGVIVYVLM
jgi:undecaprenyl-diphosphatase